MKVVLFCGGLGSRMQAHSEVIPKPLVNIGHRPILWHLMRYYAHYGHKEFILCLGYQGNVIKEYFLNYDECMSNDFNLSKGGKEIQLFKRDIDDWSITFVDTGVLSNLGERLSLVKEHLRDEEIFMANYTDALSDLPLPAYIEQFKRNDAVASIIKVQPPQSFHAVKSDQNGFVTAFELISDSDVWINAGYMIMKNSIFDYIQPGEDLNNEPFHRLIEERKLLSYPYTGFWKPMDTYKDKKEFDSMVESDHNPWRVWDPDGPE